MSGEWMVLPRAEVRPADWDAVVEASDDAWLWHRHAFQDALATWPGSADESFALARWGEAPAAVVPLRRISWRRARVLPVARWESLGGTAIAPDVQGRARTSLAQKAVSTASQRLKGGDELVVTLPPLAPAFRGERCPRINPLLELGFTNALTQTWIVDLRAGGEAVFRGMRTRARQSIRQAERAGVTVRDARDSDLDLYVAMHEATYARTGAIAHPRAYFTAIWRDLLPSGHARVFVAEHDGAVVAAANFAVHKNAALFWTGASTERGLELQANHLLQWRATQWMTGSGIDWIETGEAFPGAREGKMAGLSRFKASFGGELYPLYRGRIRREGGAELAVRALDLGRSAIAARRRPDR